MRSVVIHCDYNCCHLLWLLSSVFQFFLYLLNQITILSHGECLLKITMDRFNDFVIFILCKIRLWYLKMIYFISLFCATLPIIIVVILFTLTWKLLQGANKGGYHSTHFSSKSRRSRHHRKSTILKSDVSACTLVFDEPLHVPVSIGTILLNRYPFSTLPTLSMVKKYMGVLVSFLLWKENC